MPMPKSRLSLSRPRKTIVVVLLVCIVGLIAVVGLLVKRAVDLASEAEYTMHATDTVLVLVDGYLREHPRQWPRSWSDLESIQAPPYGLFRWPVDLPKIKARVAVDFDAKIDELAAQDSRTFSAIRSIGPHYPPHCLEMLLETIRAQVHNISREAQP